MSNRCQCGRKKIVDAVCCDACWDRGRKYDERSSNDPNYCQCGKGKIADASLCDECWERESAYDDGRG